MKTKNKIVVLLEIAIVLCSLFLVVLPAIAADQTTQKVSASEVTTASEDDYVLGVYGNANEDNNIDMRDLTYVKLIFFGKKPETELADAKYDGKINPLDFIQIKLIIVGKEKELTVIDCVDRIVTVKKPLRRIVVCKGAAIETMRSLKATDKIVGVTDSVIKNEVFFPEFSDYPSVGSGWSPDIEIIVALRPDAVIISGGRRFMVKPTVDVLESADIPVFCSLLNRLEDYREEAVMFGYILNKEKEAAEFIDFREKILTSVKEKGENIPEEKKPKVYFMPSFKDGVYYIYGMHAHIAMTGGKDIFADQPGKYMSVDTEAVMERDPDIIIRVAPSTAGGCGVDADDTAELKALRDEIMSQPELQKVKAVKDEKVYIIANHLVSFFGASGCRNFLQIAYQAKWFHPELFKDLDPKATHQEYLTRFQGLDIDLDEKGVFVYPEPS